MFQLQLLWNTKLIALMFQPSKLCRCYANSLVLIFRKQRSWIIIGRVFLLLLNVHGVHSRRERQVATHVTVQKNANPSTCLEREPNFWLTEKGIGMRSNIKSSLVKFEYSPFYFLSFSWQMGNESFPSYIPIYFFMLIFSP